MSSEALETLKLCESGVNEAKALMDRNKHKIDYYNTVEIPAYNKAYEEWKNRKSINDAKKINWRDLNGDYAWLTTKKQELTDEIKHWRDCTGPWNRVQDETHNDWCENDIGPGWYHFRDGSKHNACAWFFGIPTQWNGACKRRPERVDQEINALKGPEPIFTEIPPIIPTQPQIENPVSISCCANISQVFGSDVSDTQMLQKCEYQINSKIQEIASTPAPALPSSTVPALPSEAPSSPQNSYWIFIIVLIIIFISSSIALLYLINK